jgi:hypothetical protein
MSIQSVRREKPPSTNPAAWSEANVWGSGFDRVGAFPVLAFAGRHGQSHLLANGARQEPADRMGLPCGHFHQLFRRDTARSLEQVEDFVGLTTLAGGAGLLSGFGRFRSWAGLLGRLPLLLCNVGALWRTGGFLGGFGRFACGWSRRARGFFSSQCVHGVSFCGNHRSHIDHSVAPGKQGDSACHQKRRKVDATERQP